MHAAAAAINDARYERWRAGDELAGELVVDDWEHCHWPEGMHPFPFSPDRASRLEVEHGIPAGTFLTIRAFWRGNRAALPEAYR